MSKLFLSVVISVVWLFIVFDNFQNYSDNFYYSDAFYKISELDFFQGYNYFKWRTAGSEPFSYIVFYLFSKLGIEYEFFIFILNVLFCHSLMVLCGKYKVNIMFSMVFVLVNFYFIVMGVGVHRIKMAMTVIFYALSLSERKSKTSLLGISILFHGQAFTVVLIGVACKLVEQLKRRAISKRFFLMIFFLSCIAFGMFLSTSIWAKFYNRLDFHTFDFFSAILISIFFYIYFSGLQFGFGGCSFDVFDIYFVARRV